MQPDQPLPILGPHDFLPGDLYMESAGPSTTWVVKGLIPAGGMVGLFALPKFGKSYGALQLAHAVGGDAPDWIGFPILTHGPVLYLQLDTPASLWKERMLVLQSQGIDFPPCAACVTGDLARPHTGAHFADKHMAPYPFDILVPEQGAAWLAQQVQKIQPVLVIIDTLREVNNADEDKSGTTKIVLNTIQQICQPSAVMLITHARKPNAFVGDDAINDIRGSGQIAARLDTIMKRTSKTLLIKGRAVEDMKLAVGTLPTMFWTREGLVKEVGDETLLDLCNDTSLSDRQRAEKLSQISGRNIEASRGLIRYFRKKAGLTPPDAAP